MNDSNKSKYEVFERIKVDKLRTYLIDNMDKYYIDESNNISNGCGIIIVDEESNNNYINMYNIGINVGNILDCNKEFESIIPILVSIDNVNIGKNIDMICVTYEGIMWSKSSNNSITKIVFNGIDITKEILDQYYGINVDSNVLRSVYISKNSCPYNNIEELFVNYTISIIDYNGIISYDNMLNCTYDLLILNKDSCRLIIVLYELLIEVNGVVNVEEITNIIRKYLVPKDDHKYNVHIGNNIVDIIEYCKLE